MEPEKFTVEEFVQVSEIFGVSSDIVDAALRHDGKGVYTEAEARKVVKAFAKKEVKR